MSIREKVTHEAYKVDSTASQRDEACRFASAAYHNACIEIYNEFGEYDTRAKYKLLAEIERSALLLILERDEKGPAR